MIEEQELIILNEDELLSKIYNYAAEGYRLVQIHCTMLDDQLEMNYSFDKDCRFTNLRMIIGKEQEISSICGIYCSAFLYENEIADLYGAKIKNITPDYKGKIFQSSKKAPFTEGGKEPEKNKQE